MKNYYEWDIAYGYIDSNKCEHSISDCNQGSFTAFTLSLKKIVENPSHYNVKVNIEKIQKEDICVVTH